MLLASPRFWSFPNNWNQHQSKAINAQSGSQALIRWNYPWDRLGLTVRNKQVVIWAHNTRDRSLLELKHFTTTNLSLTGGKARPIQGASSGSGVAWQEEYDPIPAEALAVAIAAWRNWVDLNRLIHPGLLDCLAAYRCIQDSPNLTITILSTFFDKHLENRATSTTNGAVSLWDHAGASQALAMVQTQASHSKPFTGPKKFKNPTNNRSFTNNHFSHTQNFRGNTRGGGRGGGRGGRGGSSRGRGRGGANNGRTTRPGPSKLNLVPSLGKRTLCLKFNRDKPCNTVDPSGKFCTRDNSNKRYWHLCALKQGNKACGSDQHKATNH